MKATIINMEQSKLQAYAKLIATIGVNIQSGQKVIIRAQLDQPDFVVMLTEECYLAGASKVTVEWEHLPLTALHITYENEEVLSTLEPWEKEKLENQIKILPARIYLLSEDPDGLLGIDQKKYSNVTQARKIAIKPYRDQMDNRYQWCIAAVPGKAWAKRVFPHHTEKHAVELLWKAILKASRADKDPVAAWKEHNHRLMERCNYLNALHLTSLHYTASNGTDLTVGLIPDCLFMGGAEYSLQHICYNPNIPSEEIFTSPMSNKTEGIVYSSKPLSYQGELIDHFYMRFHEGKVVEAHAKINDALLQNLIQMDGGSNYLGECALIPHNSPIQNTGILFYNTLFDENASCHLALGEGFCNCLKDFENLTLEECHQKGINTSIIHEDFMIGTPDLSITGTTAEGKVISIFTDGNWAF